MPRSAARGAKRPIRNRATDGNPTRCPSVLQKHTPRFWSISQVATKLVAAPSPQFLNNAFQRTLASWNRERLAPAFPDQDWRRDFDRGTQMLRLEGAFLDELRA